VLEEQQDFSRQNLIIVAPPQATLEMLQHTPPVGEFSAERDDALKNLSEYPIFEPLADARGRIERIRGMLESVQ
jgi:hypothetical protein